jgi:hypothetical protein
MKHFVFFVDGQYHLWDMFCHSFSFPLWAWSPVNRKLTMGLLNWPGDLDGKLQAILKWIFIIEAR